ncbi:hypothetical protein ACPDHN_05665 [Myroides odoratimimus]|uniref:hypothetical protein n=1 Tax=Myroides odoratimimus TaxID=76832 RepID=UPI003D2F5C40
MKLDYRIIWVEDKIDTRPFEALVKSISQYLQNEFFNVHIDTAEDFEDFKNKYDGNQIYDLIITDLNLNESHGSEVIDFLREEKHILTEIFFYSANEEFATTKLANNSRITFYQLDGQDYHKQLLQSIIELIDLTIAKFQNIITMRGMIMHETISLDVKMEEIVRKQLGNAMLKEHMEPVIATICSNVLSSATEKYKKAESQKVKDILRDNVLFNSAQKIFALGAILDAMKEENFASKYNEEVILIRNQFAHAELQVNDQGVEYFKIKNEEVFFDRDLCKKIRHNLSNYITKISEIESKL